MKPFTQIVINMELKKHYITDNSVIKTLIEQGAILQQDEDGYFEIEVTQGS